MAIVPERPEDVCEDLASDQSKIALVSARLPASTRDLAGLFQILSDDVRCKIVSALIGEELCVCELAEIAGTSVSNASHHLRLLRAARLVKYRKSQKRVFYSLDDDHVTTLISQGLEHINHR